MKTKSVNEFDFFFVMANYSRLTLLRLLPVSLIFIVYLWFFGRF